jgi:type I restriction enzyme S subunit
MTTDKNNFFLRQASAARVARRKENVVFTSCSRCFPIDTQAIRSKILDLAMRGNLTEQLPEDGTAEELYRQIQKEKQALSKAGKIKKEKPLPEIGEDEIPFEIPANWTWVALGNLTSKITSGNTPPGGRKSDVYVPNGFPFFREQNIYNDGIHQTGMVFISESLLATRQNSTVKAKDILLNITGGSIGRCALVPDDFDRGSINQHILIIRAVEPETRYYLHLLICSPYVQSQIKTGAVGDKDGFSSGRCKKILVPLPPLAEQQRIVEKIEQAFSALDTIDALQAQYADNLTALKTKLIDAAIQGKLTEQLPEDGTAEDLYRQIQAGKQALIQAGKIKKEKPLPPVEEGEIPFEIPPNWKWVRIGSIGITVTGGTPSKALPAYYGGNYPFFKPSDLDAGRHITKASEYLTEEGKKVSRQLQRGSILVCCIGSIGKAAIIDTDGTANQQITALTPLESDSDYLLYAIASGAFQHQLEQGSRATTVSIINKSKFDNCILPLPPFAEQRRIVNRLNEFLTVCDKMK